ncbi:MAG: X-Pro aminopeptidase, partial [Hyphomicrobiales bacterium]
MFESLYQSFEDRADPSQGAIRIAALRAEFARLGLDGFLVPRADEHQNEYVAACEERLAWLSGFTGSAGLAIVLKASAAIFVDGRYSLRVKDQVDLSLFKPEALTETSPQDWLKTNLSPGARLGYDPWLHTPRRVKCLGKATQAAGAELVAVEQNPIDAIWTDRPPPPLGKISLHGLRFAGENAKRKLARAAAALG